MGTACVFRLFGIGWFRADYSSIPTISLPIQALISFVTYVFDWIFILKVLCKINTFKIFLISIALYFLSRPFHDHKLELIIIEIAIWLILPLYFNQDKRISFIKNASMVFVVTTYAALFLVGRFDLNIEIRSSCMVLLLSLIDYKLLFVNIYLIDKLRGGKLWTGFGTGLLVRVDALASSVIKIPVIQTFRNSLGSKTNRRKK